MSLWLVRAGRYGEFEDRFFRTSRIYLTWDSLQDRSLERARDFSDIRRILKEAHPGDSDGTVGNWTGQIGAFLLGMKEGDWVVTPRKPKSTIAFGEVSGPYKFDLEADTPFRHSRTVKWLHLDVPRSEFEQDLLYSFGAAQTICEIKRNDAEKRVRQMSKAGWKSGSSTEVPKGDEIASAEAAGDGVDLERLARDQIAKLIIQTFKGHGMARLVEGVLKAQGYTTYRSPEGPDGSVDILAAQGPLGFGQPRICVQVKSGDGLTDLPTLNQLRGAMENVQAEQGLLVAWGGFKLSVAKEEPRQFFRVRLWDQETLIEELLLHYDKLDDDLRAELPLKRAWMVARQDSE